MPLWLGIVLGLAAGSIIAGIAAWLILKPRTEQVLADAEADIEKRKKKSEQDAASVIESAKKEAHQTRLEAEKVAERRFQDVARSEERLDRRAEKLESQQKQLER